MFRGRFPNGPPAHDPHPMIFAFCEVPCQRFPVVEA
jgi:hypothetical protein